MRIRDALSGHVREFHLAQDVAAAPGDWSDYFRTLARRLVRDFPGRWRGVDLAFASDLPPAAGISSSSALLIAGWLALSDVNELAAHPRHSAIARPEDLAGYLGAVENGRPFGLFDAAGGVGTLGGAQDQCAILCSRADHLLRVGFAPVRLEALVPVPAGLIFAVAASGVAAPKTGSALEHYNAIARRTAWLWQLTASHAPPGRTTLGAALDAGPEVAGLFRARIRDQVSNPAERDRLLRRLDQLREECVELVPGVAAALGGGDLDRVASLVARSQAGAVMALENQVPETVHLVRSARECGAVAASAFGAGFGGSVWALIPRPAAAEFLVAWRTAYLADFPGRAASSRFILTRPAPPAARL